MPSRQPVPVRIRETAPSPSLEWLERGPIAGPLFEESVNARRRELSALGVASRLTDLDALAGASTDDCTARPAALLFHTSRCGSTLLTRMLASLDDASVIAESVILDQLLNGLGVLATPDATRICLLRGFVQAHARSARQGRCWVKFDCHHLFHLNLIRHAFPGVPWVFLYRDPVEVIVSHARQQGLAMIPAEAEILAWPGFGHRPMRDLLDEHTARMIGRICAVAAEAHRPGESLLVNHRDLADRLHTEILPFIGVSASAAELDRITRCLLENAKHPGQPFVPDSTTKRADASLLIRAASARWAQAAYEHVERCGSPRSGLRPV